MFPDLIILVKNLFTSLKNQEITEEMAEQKLTMALRNYEEALKDLSVEKEQKQEGRS